jgi:hypothetical protein
VIDELPELETPGWLAVKTTLHLWSQIVGKTRLALEPMLNHWWQVTLMVTPTGLATPVMHQGARSLQVSFDLVDHALRVVDDAGRDHGFALAPMTVSAFYRRYRAALAAAGVHVKMRARPTEMVEAIPFADDETHGSYDRSWASAFARVLRTVDATLDEFRGRFIGKASPVHFFWGGFDLAVTRFSGRRAPRHPGGIPNCADWVMVEAYSHEVSSAGFWPGDETNGPAFYAYAYPEPPGFALAPLRPAAARYDAAVREFILPYADVRRAADPRGDVLAFLESTYEAAAELGRWDRAAVERQEMR